MAGPWLFSDSTLYAREAVAILAHGWNALREGVHDYTILYPLLLSPAFLHESRAEAHQAALAINALISSSAVFPLYWIARRMLSRRLSVVLTAVVGLLPSLFVYALALSSENLFLPLFWWGTFFLLRLAERDRWTDALAAGFAIGLLPAVKLTGFAILAAAAALVAGMALFHRVHKARAAACLAALFLPQLAWVLVREAWGGPERGLFGFGPGVGDSLVASLGRMDREGLNAFLRYFLGETTYFMVGAYVAWIAFSLYLVSQYRTWRARSVEGFLLVWTFLAAAALVLVTVFLLFPIAQSLSDPEQRARAIYGRFIEVLFPAFFILGTRGMLDFAWKDGTERAWRRELLLLFAIFFFTAVSFYPLTGYSVASPFRRYAFAWLAELLSVRAETLLLLLPLLLLPSLLALAWPLLRSGRGRRVALGPALAGALAVHVLVFVVTLGGVVRGAQARNASLFRIGRWLESRDAPSTRVAYDAALGYGDQYFAYRFWSGGVWEVLSSDSLLAQGADYVVTRRRLALPLRVEETNGVRLYEASR